ncbi:Crp/Fnr family transcriptional regulator, partial [Burkholderia pseudomallei]
MRTPFARPAAAAAPVHASSTWAPRQAAHCSKCAMRHLCMPQGHAPEA